MLPISFFYCYSHDFCCVYSLHISLSSLCILYSEEGSEDVLFRAIHHCLSPGHQNERIYFIWPNCLVPHLPSDCFLSNCLEVKLLQTLETSIHIQSIRNILSPPTSLISFLINEKWIRLSSSISALYSGLCELGLAERASDGALKGI